MPHLGLSSPSKSNSVSGPECEFPRVCCRPMGDHGRSCISTARNALVCCVPVWSWTCDGPAVEIAEGLGDMCLCATLDRMALGSCHGFGARPVRACNAGASICARVALTRTEDATRDSHPDNTDVTVYTLWHGTAHGCERWTDQWSCPELFPHGGVSEWSSSRNVAIELLDTVPRCQKPSNGKSEETLNVAPSRVRAHHSKSAGW